MWPDLQDLDKIFLASKKPVLVIEVHKKKQKRLQRYRICLLLTKYEFGKSISLPVNSCIDCINPQPASGKGVCDQ